MDLDAAVMRTKSSSTSRRMESTLVARFLLLVLVTSSCMFAKTSAQSEGNCTSPLIVTDTVFRDFDSPSVGKACQGVWTIGTDLCNPDSFVRYYNCNPGLCTILREDYLFDTPVYFRCEAQNKIYQFKTRPIVDITAPDFLVAGEVMTVVTVVKAVPRPQLPELYIQLQQLNSVNTTHDNVTVSYRDVIPNNYTYIRFHYFTIPRTVTPNNTTVRIDVRVPEETVDAVTIIDAIPIIPGEPEPPDVPTTTESVTTATTDSVANQTTNTGTEGTTTNGSIPAPPPTGGVKSTCPIGSEAMAGAVVGSVLLTNIVSVGATVLVICFCWKKIDRKRRESLANGPRTPFTTPGSLPLHSLTPVSDYPTPTPPGITPTMETAHLLTSESRRRGNSYSPSRSVSATNRQYSRYSSQASDSPTTPTPNSLAPPTSNGVAPPIYRGMDHNEASAAAAASSPTIIHVTRGASSQLFGSGADARGHVDTPLLMPEEISSKDSEKHVYSTIPVSPDLRQYPPALRPLPETPPHEDLPSPLVPVVSHVTAPSDQVDTPQSPVPESPYGTQGNNMVLPPQEGEPMTGAAV